MLAVPSSVPPGDGNTSFPAPDSVIVPPLIVPPASTHGPVASVNASVSPVLSSVPLSVTAVWLYAIPCAWPLVRLPARFSVEPVPEIVRLPSADGAPPTVTAEPLAAIVPALAQALEELPRFSVAPVAVIADPAALVHVPLSVRLVPAGADSPRSTT